jgi:hypothetical protein
MMFLMLNFSTLRASGSFPGITVINQLDSVIFDLSQSVCASGQVTFPVYFKSDDPIYAVDFSLKFNPNGFTFSTVNNIQSGLFTSAYYNNSDSTLRFTSYSITPMINNSPLVTLRFNLPSANISLARFDSVYTLLNGDDCSRRFINPNIPAGIGLIGSPVIIPGDCSTLFINTQAGLNYLWSTGQTAAQITVCLPGTYSVTVSAVQGCNAVSQFTLLAPSPLPVELLYFKGKQVRDRIILEWATASELNNDHFTIEKRKTDGSWMACGNISGAGTTNHQNNYVFEDLNPSSGVNVYRLSQTDYDGSVQILSEEAVHFLVKEAFSVSVMPNPFQLYNHETLKVNFPCHGAVTSARLIETLSGKIYRHLPDINEVAAGNCQTELKLHQDISTGAYQLIIETEQGTFSTGVVILK